MRKNSAIAKAPGRSIPSFAQGFVDESTRKRLKHIVAPHVDSFNYFLEMGLKTAIANMLPLDMKLGDNGPFITMKVESAQIAFPTKKDDMVEKELTPREARERGMTYAGAMSANLTVELSDGNKFDVQVRLGQLPIMVMSEKCHLRGASGKKLVFDFKEEANEMGGYFILNGIERVVCFF